MGKHGIGCGHSPGGRRIEQRAARNPQSGIVGTDHQHLLSPAPEHFNQACDWLAKPECALRSADALHLAIAFGGGCKQFVSFDQLLGVAARKLGLAYLLLKPKK